MTAKEWKQKNSNLEGSIRDNTDLLHLIILSNLENTNSELIRKGITQKERLMLLNESARIQMNLFINNKNIKELEKIKD